MSDVPEDDLFGDTVIENENASRKDESELSSPAAADISQEYPVGQDKDEEERIIMETFLYQHRMPRTKNGNFKTLRVPPMFKFDPIPYTAATYEPTKWDKTNAQQEHPKRVVRHQVAEGGRIESNTHIHRWSDGSMTISVGDEHFELDRQALAPRGHEAYDPLRDAHCYAAAAHLATNMLVLVGHVTDQLLVRPKDVLGVDDAGIAEFKLRMAEEQAARQAVKLDAQAMKLAQIDPEQSKRAALLAEKERIKAERKRAATQARQTVGGKYAGGLSIDGLEGSAKSRAGAKKRDAAYGAGRGKHRLGYDSDDDAGTRRRDDKYDYDDEFLVRSDEDISEAEDEGLLDDVDEEEEEEEEESERPAPSRPFKRQRTEEREMEAKERAKPKQKPAPVVVARNAHPDPERDEDENEDEDEDEDENDIPVERTRHRGRQAILMDEDDEDE